MRFGFALALVLLTCLAACGGKTPGPATPKTDKACLSDSVPNGRWTGEWESALMSKPDFTRSGSIDLVISENGTMLGQTVEHESGYSGQLSGTVHKGGEFQGEYVVSRDGTNHRYAVKGNFTCDSDGLAGKGVVTWGSNSDRGNLSFSIQRTE